MQEPTQKDFLMAIAAKHFYISRDDIPMEYIVATEKVEKYILKEEMKELHNLHLHIRRSFLCKE